MQVVLEQRLHPAKNEVAASRGVEHEREVLWHQILRDGIALDPGQARHSAHEPMRHRVHERQNVTASVCAWFFVGVGDLYDLENSSPRLVRLGRGRIEVTAANEPLGYCDGIQTEQ
jgi:hypothetical protein